MIYVGYMEIKCNRMEEDAGNYALVMRLRLLFKSSNKMDNCADSFSVDLNAVDLDLLFSTRHRRKLLLKVNVTYKSSIYWLHQRPDLLWRYANAKLFTSHSHI